MNRDWWDGIDKEAAKKRAAAAREKILRDQVEAIRDRSLIEDPQEPSFEFSEEKTSDTAIALIGVLLDAHEFIEIESLLREAKELKHAESGEDYEF